jgi:hypothetical protein
MSASKTWDMYAHWLVSEYRSAFRDFNANPEIVKLYGKYPIHRVRVTLVEGEHSGLYWGWLATDGKYPEYMYPLRDAVEVCFPYGSKCEEEKGRGKVVGLLVEDLGEVGREVHISGT